MITVNFYATVRMIVGRKQLTVSSKAFDVAGLLEECETVTGKRFINKLLNEAGAIIPGVIILVDGINIHHLDGTASAVKDGAVVSVFPPGGGG
ncbi:MAG: MoaD/ThiS family protein [Desulfobacterales bacterium]|nr:MoaD/ThiS family protein [Desulfobacterales bacterium]MDD4073243.1 MoaD/ThiS family protein [Desulfobacterales bacterium]